VKVYENQKLNMIYREILKNIRDVHKYVEIDMNAQYTGPIKRLKIKDI